MQLLQKRAETEITEVMTDDKFTFRVSSCAVLPKAKTLETD